MISCSRTQGGVCEIAEMRYRLHAGEETRPRRLIQRKGQVPLNTVIRSLSGDKGPADVFRPRFSVESRRLGGPKVSRPEVRRLSVRGR